MNGTITLNSVVRKGSTATFVVPLRVSSHRPGTASSSTSQDLPPFSPTTSLTTPLWTEPSSQRAANQDILNINLLNQQISASATQYSSPALRTGSRHTSVDLTAQLPPEQRSQIHVLVVEDKYFPPSPTYIFAK